MGTESSEHGQTSALPAWIHPALVIIFTLSGASALAYQILWTRQLGFVLGGSAIAISTILAVFFAGLGLGSFLGGRFADRVRNPLAAYGIAELVIAASALATPFLLSASGTVYLGVHRLLGDDPALVLLGRTLATAVILIVPTTLMGATLPLVSRFYVRSIDHLGRGLSLLYGVNTFGGMLGAGFVGYYSILAFGVQVSFYVAVAANCAAALTALLISRGRGLTGAPPASETTRGRAAKAESGAAGSPRLLWLASAGFFVSGFTAIAYEVLWTRALNFAIGNSVYAFTTIIVVFLAGLVPGALLAGRLADRSTRRVQSLGIVQLLTAVVTLALFSQAGRLPKMSKDLFDAFGSGSLFADVITKILPAAVALFLPALVIGLTFPFILRVVTYQLERLGRRVGSFYAINTVGGILGSIVAGFVLLPTVGLTRSMILVALVNVLMGMVFLANAESPRIRRSGTILAIGLAVALLVTSVVVRPTPFIRYTSKGSAEGVELLFCEEGHTATVSVTENNGGDWPGRTLWINLLGASVTDTLHHHQQYYTLLSLYPIALHASPKQVFVAGLASGVTTGAAGLDERTDSVTCVEISPEVIDAAPLFDEYNFSVVDNPKVEILPDDARAYLATTDEKFDVLVNDVYISAVTGTSALYSKDYFELCRRKLAPGGLMSVGGGALNSIDQTVARTFIEVFPYVACFAVDDRSAYNRTFLVGSNEPFQFTRKSIEAAYAQPRIAREWARYGIPRPADLISTYLCDRGPLYAHIENAPVCTDDKPVIDFLAVAWAEGLLATHSKTGIPGVRALLRKTGGTRSIPNLGP